MIITLEWATHNQPVFNILLCLINAGFGDSQQEFDSATLGLDCWSSYEIMEGAVSL